MVNINKENAFKTNSSDNIDLNKLSNLEKEFSDYSKKTPIEFLDNNESSIKILISVIKKIFISSYVFFSKSIFSIINVLNKHFGDSFSKSISNKILKCKRYSSRINEQFDTNIEKKFDSNIKNEYVDPIMDKFNKVYYETLQDQINQMKK